jgi:hypothetical protein
MVHVFEKLIMIGSADVSKFQREINLRLQFSTRAQRDIQELSILSIVNTIESLRYIRRNRDTGTPHLTDEPVQFIVGKIPGYAVDIDDYLFPEFQTSRSRKLLIFILMDGSSFLIPTRSASRATFH